MPAVKTANDPLRRHYELVSNQELRHSQWLTIRDNLIKSGMLLSKQSIEKYAKFRKLSPRKHLSKKQKDRFQAFINTYGSHTEIAGIELIEVATKLNPSIKGNPAQIRKRFYVVGLPCSKSLMYSFDDACKAIASVILYSPRGVGSGNN